MVRNVVLEVLDSNQKNRLLEDPGSGTSGQEASQDPSVLQGEAELAYLTHEGLFISDALSDAQQHQQTVLASQDHSSAVASRAQHSRVETPAGDVSSGSTETSASREQSFMYVTHSLLLLPPPPAQTGSTCGLVVVVAFTRCVCVGVQVW